MDLETCKQLIAHFEQRKSWSTKTLKTIMFDVVMGKPFCVPTEDDETIPPAREVMPNVELA